MAGPLLLGWLAGCRLRLQAHRAKSLPPANRPFLPPARTGRLHGRHQPPRGDAEPVQVRGAVPDAACRDWMQACQRYTGAALHLTLIKCPPPRPAAASPRRTAACSSSSSHRRQGPLTPLTAAGGATASAATGAPSPCAAPLASCRLPQPTAIPPPPAGHFGGGRRAAGVPGCGAGDPGGLCAHRAGGAEKERKQNRALPGWPPAAPACPGCACRVCSSAAMVC